jgi:tetratricopeptide (TPR) repeat protein
MTDESHIAQITRQADSCLDNGDLAQARRLYAEICRARDNDAQAWLMYGAINGELGNVEVARSALERAVALDPANAEAHLALAHLLRSAQKPAEAMTAAGRAVEADAGFVEGWLFIAAVAGQQSDWPRAEEACNKAIALTPGQTEGHVNLGNVLLATGRLPRAEESFRKALALGETAEAWFGLGTALGAQERHAEAEPALAAALRHNAGSAVFREALASCLDRLERSEEAAAVRKGSVPYSH